MTADSKGKDAQSSSKRINQPVLVRTSVEQPRNSFCLWLHRLLLPVVTGPQSLRIVASFQRLCGLRADGTVTNHFLHAYFKLASTAGEEIFSLMPLLLWLAFPVGVPFVTNFMVLLMVGQLAKDFLMLPRPSSPADATDDYRIVKLDTHFETEYGMPSTHTMSGFLPQVVMLALSRLCAVQLSPLHWALSAVYTVSVALSRLYLGVHSVYDVVGGALLSLLLVLLLHRCGDQLDDFLYRSHAGVFCIAAAAVAFLTAYPRTKPWSAAYGTSAQIFGSWLGAALSFWIVYQCSPELHCALLQNSITPMCHSSSYDATAAATAATAACMSVEVPPQLLVQRVLLSLALAGTAKVIGKLLPTALLSQLHRVGALQQPHPQEQVDCFGQSVPLHKAYYFEVPVRLFNYAALGVVTVLLCPYCWQRWLPIQ